MKFIIHFKKRVLKAYSLIAVVLLFVSNCLAQTDTVRLPVSLRFPMDQVSKLYFLRDLNQFLNTHTTTASSAAVDLMTMPLTDELVGIKNNKQLSDSMFYKAYLNNIVSLEDTGYLVQLAYLGIQNELPVLRAGINLIARRMNKRFVFSSPLSANIKGWKREKINHITFFFPEHMDREKADQFSKLDAFYNEKINAPGQETVFIEADNFPSALRLAGVNFKSDYAGQAYNSLADYSDNRRVVISGRAGSFPNYDPHDTWHDKLRTVMPDSIINRPVDEGCAYLFGGSWGYTWPQVLDTFKVYVRQHPDADWLSLYKNAGSFSMGKYQNAIANVLNALLVEKIQKEKGFPAVMRLLGCGRREKGDSNYFNMLRQITGISEATFNKEINKLL